MIHGSCWSLCLSLTLIISSGVGGIVSCRWAQPWHFWCRTCCVSVVLSFVSWSIRCKIISFQLCHLQSEVSWTSDHFLCVFLCTLHSIYSFCWPLCLVDFLDYNCFRVMWLQIMVNSAAGDGKEFDVLDYILKWGGIVSYKLDITFLLLSH